MTDLATIDSADLQRELAERTERARAEQADRAARLRAKQDAYELNVIAQHRTLDEQLTEHGSNAGREFEAAARRGDIAAAMQSWVTEFACRHARAAIRSMAEGYEQRHRTGKSVLSSDMRSRDPDFLHRLEENLYRASEAAAQDIVEQWIGEPPTEAD